MNAVAGALLVAASFTLGAVPFGVLVSRAFYGRDIRAAGSGNIGAANALRTLGKRGAIAVLLLDALKGYAPTVAGVAVGGPALGAFCALAAVIGHCFSPFLGFRGGKGVATFFGTLFGMSWPAGIAFAIVWLGAAIAFGYASLASLLATAAMPFVLWYLVAMPGAVDGVVALVLIVWAHRANLGRLRRGEEPQLQFFGSSARG